MGPQHGFIWLTVHDRGVSAAYVSGALLGCIIYCVSVFRFRTGNRQQLWTEENPSPLRTVKWPSPSAPANEHIRK